MVPEEILKAVFPFLEDTDLAICTLVCRKWQNIVQDDLLLGFAMHKMHSEEILGAVFPFLKGTELAKCMSVCKKWRDIAQDDYYWKCLCSKIWPSIGKGQSPPTLTYYELFKTYYTKHSHRTVLPPRHSFDKLEFYVDIWVDEKTIFSDVVPGPALQDTWISPPGISDTPEYKMIVPRVTISWGQNVGISVLVGHKDTREVAWIMKKFLFDPSSLSEYLDPSTPFIGARISSLCIDSDFKWVSVGFREAPTTTKTTPQFQTSWDRLYEFSVIMLPI